MPARHESTASKVAADMKVTLDCIKTNMDYIGARLAEIRNDPNDTNGDDGEDDHRFEQMKEQADYLIAQGDALKRKLAENEEEIERLREEQQRRRRIRAALEDDFDPVKITFVYLATIAVTMAIVVNVLNGKPWYHSYF